MKYRSPFVCAAASALVGCASAPALSPSAPPEPARRPVVVHMHVSPPQAQAAAAEGDGAKAKQAPDPAASCGASEVYVPPTGDAGFLMGKGMKTGAHVVVLTHGFCMDANEVTVREFSACVDAKTCAPPWAGDPTSTYPRFPDHPVNMVSWIEATKYCASLGKRLPTEAEWEWAATGPEQYKYPWGDSPGPSCETCDYTHWGAPKWNAGGDVGCGGGGPSAVDTHPKGDRVWPAGHIHDLAGNVWEWTQDTYAPYPADAQTDPVVTDARVSVHIMRGGGWNRSYAAMEVTYRAYSPATYAVPATGVRCVRSAP
jgi:formylglycine-generating enzyme required for sulfatase activity